MNNNEWLAIDVLEDYLDGKLDAKTMHRIERISLEDPFVAEALAGLSLSPKRTQSLSLLQKQLQERIAQKPIEVKRWQITSQRLSIAAAAAVLFVTVSLLFWMRESSNREKIAASAPKKVEVAIAATNEPEKASIKAKEEVEKLIGETKKNRYANKLPKQPTKATLTAINSAADISKASLENKNDEISLRTTMAQEKKKELAVKQAASALSGKVAGIQINRRNLINGVVYGDDKMPIPGATVKLKESSQSVTTDKKGHFNLAIDSLLKNPTLNVAYLGFMPKEVSVKNNENLAIELRPSAESLNEVVVNAEGVNKKVLEAQKNNLVVKGVVLDENNRPIAGAVVKLNEGRKMVIVNSNGEFSLKLDSITGNPKLNVLHGGYLPKQVDAIPNEEIIVQLIKPTEPYHIVLGGPTPIDGLPSYNKYLKSNNRLTQNGYIYKDVLLRFDIDKEGRPSDIKVQYGIDKIHDEEAIRLVKEGPKWNFRPVGHNAVTLSVQF
ncbi:carboxypeptidase-like regulatory domain-containing protein [Pedobacter sp. Du54]|uniref:carboxypeptidase-like regulatory domain-containing protein n=1 Tax=Pedobacter anseongensis TaxID=3133439 RepID=UPI00309CAADC